MYILSYSFICGSIKYGFEPNEIYCAIITVMVYEVSMPSTYGRLKNFFRSDSQERVHELLPTPDEAHESRKKVYSDHLPRGGEWSPFEHKSPLNYRIWNIMGSGASGFDKGDCDFITNETDKERISRNRRITNTIKKWQKDQKNNVDFIALQEVAEPKEIIKLLKLDENKWGYVFNGSTQTL